MIYENHSRHGIMPDRLIINVEVKETKLLWGRMRVAFSCARKFEPQPSIEALQESGKLLILDFQRVFFLGVNTVLNFVL